mgnify:CR=1 FL=1
MYDFFTKNFDDYIIENSKNFLIFLIPGKKLSDKFEWYGEQRAKAFKIFNSIPIKNDIEDRDFFFSHMMIWNKEEKQLAGGQRFLFSNKGCVRNKENSYLEYYHPGTFEKMINESFCEIGRTFVMPNHQNKMILKELIRGFLRIPESKKIGLGIGLISFNHKSLNKDCINAFLKILKLSNNKPLNLPNGKYLYEYQMEYKVNSKEFKIEANKIKFIEKELQKLDNNFKMPQVLKPYLRYCSISYENYSIANEYNGVMQLLFTGRSENITENQRKYLPKYNFKKYFHQQAV